MDWPACVHNANTTCPLLSMLMLSLLGSSLIFCHFLPSSFCVCEDANVTHKVSIVKKKKKKEITSLGLFAVQLWYLLRSPHVMENNKHRSKIGGDMQTDIQLLWLSWKIIKNKTVCHWSPLKGFHLIFPWTPAHYNTLRRLSKSWSQKRVGLNKKRMQSFTNQVCLQTTVCQLFLSTCTNILYTTICFTK